MLTSRSKWHLLHLVRCSPFGATPFSEAGSSGHEQPFRFYPKRFAAQFYTNLLSLFARPSVGSDNSTVNAVTPTRQGAQRRTGGMTSPIRTLHAVTPDNHDCRNSFWHNFPTSDQQISLINIRLPLSCPSSIIFEGRFLKGLEILTINPEHPD